MKIRRFGQRLALAFGAAAFFLAAAELSSRLIVSPAELYEATIFEFDADKGFALKKNLVRREFAGRSVSTNSRGYRDREVPPRAATNDRILLLGDSVSFGHGIEANETFADQLEALLSTVRQGPVEVINTAAPGNGPLQEYHDLRRGLALEPDLVLIQFDLNDVMEPYVTRRRDRALGADYHGIRPRRAQRWLARHSALYLVAEEGWRRLRWGAWTSDAIRARALDEARSVHWAAAADPPRDEAVREAWTDCLAWLEASVDLCRERSVPCVLLVCFHDFQLLQPDRRYAQQRLRQFADEAGIEMIDLLPWMEELVRARLTAEHGLPGETSFGDLLAGQFQDVIRVAGEHFLDYGHFSPHGHRVLAQHLRERIEKRVLLTESLRDRTP